MSEESKTDLPHGLPHETIMKYFDVIYEFGLLTNTGLSPCESPGQPLRIPISYRDKAGLLHSCTAYGTNLIEVCQRAVDFLEPRGWIGHGEELKRGLYGAAIAITNTISKAVEIGKVEIVP